jgi:hypothetical protein
MTVKYTENVGAQGRTRTDTPLLAGDFESKSDIVFKRLFVEYRSFFFDIST